MREKYGLSWPDEIDDAFIEREMLKKGGRFRLRGKWYGLGMHQHFKNYWECLWPEDSQTWWTDLIITEILKNQFNALVGPASAWKSATCSRLALMDWSCWPDCTSVIMSSTDLNGLRNRIFGETTMMWKRAKERCDWFPGHAIDSRLVITHDNIDEEKARDIRNSILGVPCLSSTGTFLGVGRYAGRKNRRVWCLADEFQFMKISILEAQDNLISNDDGSGNFGAGVYGTDHQDPKEVGLPRRMYRCVFMGNTNPSVRDNPLDIVSEPELGWGSLPEPDMIRGKTQVWKCKKHPKHPVQCHCINLDGLDSPNSGYPIDRPRYAQLAGPHKVAKYTEGSESYWSNGRGVFKFGLDAFKIITKEVCEKFHAFDSTAFMEETVKIGMCDAAYGVVGGDRCALGSLEFGRCVDGKVRILLHPYHLVPVTIRKDMLPEDQIAFYTKEKMEIAGVKPENFFFDGRGSLAMAFARIWSPQVNAIEFGGVPTDRPAGPDLFTVDKKDGKRRLKTAREHYSKFVSELWWSWRYITESDQLRGLTLDACLDAQPREWYKVAHDKIEIESKVDMKKRTGVSPDLADMVVTGIEGARRRGFVIDNLLSPITANDAPDEKWMKMFTDLEAHRKEFQLASY